MNIAYAIESISDCVGRGVIAQEPVLPGGRIYTLAQDTLAVIIGVEWLDVYIREFYASKTVEFFRYSFCCDENHCVDISLSDARFVNHSHYPNSSMDEHGNSVCIRPIQVGEQVTEDYTKYGNPHQYQALALLYNEKTLQEQVNYFSDPPGTNTFDAVPQIPDTDLLESGQSKLRPVKTPAKVEEFFYFL
jgi:hypothetical protein